MSPETPTPDSPDAVTPGPPRPTKLSVIIPVYNEARTIATVVRRVLDVDVGLDKEIIIVDDCSTDGTREVYPTLPAGGNNAEIRVVYHERNRGKGAAIRTALQHVTGDIVLIQDADLEYDPRDYPRLLAPILDGRADVVYGSRLLSSEAHRVLFFWHMVANKFLTTLSNMLTNLNLSDMETGYKVFRREVLDGITIRCDRFGFEPEITAKIARKRCRIYEVGISYAGRGYEEGKKITWWDGVKALFAIVRFRFFN